MEVRKDRKTENENRRVDVVSRERDKNSYL